MLHGPDKTSVIEISSLTLETGSIVRGNTPGTYLVQEGGTYAPDDLVPCRRQVDPATLATGSYPAWICAGLPQSQDGKIYIDESLIALLQYNSDPIVRLEAKAPGRNAAIESLQLLEKTLQSGSNELRLTADERVAVLSKSRSLREQLIDGRIWVDDIFQAVAKVGFLLWLADKVAGTAVEEASKAAFVALYMLAKALMG
jgi:hypothetical protein